MGRFNECMSFFPELFLLRMRIHYDKGNVLLLIFPIITYRVKGKQNIIVIVCQINTKLHKAAFNWRTKAAFFRRHFFLFIILWQDWHENTQCNNPFYLNAVSFCLNVIAALWSLVFIQKTIAIDFGFPFDSINHCREMLNKKCFFALVNRPSLPIEFVQITFTVITGV